ncbi:MAG: hypothetical protein O3C29_05870 [Proteobacteria bacterium]|jgi:hypothetical protein|nr:hypothetical protein [Pseudomonadota bacterium]MDA1291996.1 hypothetical protein [Pseudomonadota bacterium]
MKVGLIHLFCCVSLLACGSLDTTIRDPVQWWAINSYGSPVTIELYDNNCSRMLRDLKLKANEEVMVVSCGDGEGHANIRFRREGYPARSDPWGPDARLRENQSTLVR